MKLVTYQAMGDKMEFEEFLNIDRNLVDEYISEVSELLYSTGKKLIETKNEYRETKIIHDEEEAKLVADMIANPKDYALRKTTNNDITYAVARNTENIVRRQDENILLKKIDTFELEYNIIKENLEIVKKLV